MMRCSDVHLHHCPPRCLSSSHFAALPVLCQLLCPIPCRFFFAFPAGVKPVNLNRSLKAAKPLGSGRLSEADRCAPASAKAATTMATTKTAKIAIPTITSSPTTTMTTTPNYCCYSCRQEPHIMNTGSLTTATAGNSKAQSPAQN